MAEVIRLRLGAIMTFTLTGSVCGRIAEGIQDPLTGGTLRLYWPSEGGQGVERADGGEVTGRRDISQQRGSFQVLEREAVEAKSDRLLDEAEIEAGGEFSVELGERESDGAAGSDEDYRGGPFQADVRLEQLPDKQSRDNADPIQFTIATIMPDWQEDETGMAATWHHCLTAKQWCGIQAMFGWWTVHGQVTNTFGRQVGNATVTAFDADIVEDDKIGSDTTDATGRYRIDYRKPDFEKTPTPWPPIELEHGPDLYFAVERGGDVELDETRSDGRQPDREDASHCERIDLMIPAFGFETPTLWTGIGTDFTVPSNPSDLNDLDAEGYMGTKKYALTGNPNMTGNISEDDFIDRSDPSNTASIEYRFAVFDTTGRGLLNNTTPPSDIEDADNGQIVNGRLFSSTDIGTIQYFPSGGEVSFDVTLKEKHVGSDGWIDVRAVVDDAFTEPDTGPATDLKGALENHGPVHWDDADPLIGINTNAVTSESTPSSNPGDIDDTLRNGTTQTEKMAVRFEIRQPGSTSTDRGKTVNSIVVNNTGIFRELEVFNSDGNPVTCQGQSGDMTLKFNVYHPHLRDANLKIKANDESADSIAPPDVANPPNEVIPGDNTDPTTESASGSFDITKKLDHTCAYSVKLWTQRRLHTGDVAVSGDGNIEEVFYYDDSGS